MYFSPRLTLAGLLALFSTASALDTPIDNANLTSASTNVSSTFITSITSTSTPSPSLLEKRTPVPSNLACYNQQKDCKNVDFQQHVVDKNAGSICSGKNFKGVIAKPGWEGTAGWMRNKYHMSYNIKVEWKDGCTMPGEGTMNIQNPAPGVTCHDLAYSSWKNCKNNGGRGGKLEFGCLEYHYNTINGDTVGYDYCGDVPFGNWTR